MRNSDIFKVTLAAICEDPSSSVNTQDYNMRAQFLLADFITQYAPLDASYRVANGMESQKIPTDVTLIDPEDDFPLCDVFTPVAIDYLASALVIDENEEMSDRFFDRYINGILEIRKALPAKQHPIVDRYGLD